MSSLTACASLHSGVAVQAGASVTPSTLTPSTSNAVINVTRLSAPEAAPHEVDVQFDPAGAQVPNISADQAYATCGTGESVCGPGLPTSDMLALVTSLASGTPNSDGTVTPAIVKRFSYVMTWTGVKCAPVGPATPGTSAAPADTTCTYVAVVDALSGQNLFGYRTGSTR